MIDEEDTYRFDNRMDRRMEREESIKRLAVVSEEDINRSGDLESRTIVLNDQISAYEFDRIVEIVLAGGEMGIHGTFYGDLPSYYFEGIQVFIIPSRSWWQEDNWYEDLISGENYATGLDLCVGQYYDPLQIHSYTIHRDTVSLGNATDSINNFTLSVSWVDTEITDEQILMQFTSYMAEVRRMI